MATVRIGRSWSYCEDCKRGAFPSEDGHITEAGWTVPHPEGCGAKWDAILLEYVMFGEEPDKEHIYEMFPNLAGLPFVGWNN